MTNERTKPMIARLAERLRLALALRLAVRNAPRVKDGEAIVIDPALASEAAGALEDAAKEGATEGSRRPNVGIA